MNVLVLGPNAEQLAPIVGDVPSTEDPITVEQAASYDLLVSYGYRHIVRPPVLEVVRAVNLHISLLPWNRGADPNLWSWIDGTPKGVTVHWMTAGVDEGPIITQREVDLDPESTLAESYQQLQDAMVATFAEAWPAILRGDPGTPQPAGGTCHRVADRPDGVMPQGWDTPCWMVSRGRRGARP